MTQQHASPLQAGLSVLALAGTLAACSSSAAVVPSTSVRPGSPPAAVTVDEHAAGRTIRLGSGTTIRLVLHSTYWSAPRSSAPDVLGPVGMPKVTRGNCHAGMGCGTVEAGYLTKRPGTATLTATRTSCGEAMRCPPGSRVFTVTVTVTATAG